MVRPGKKLNRRSFLKRTGGGVAGAGAALALPMIVPSRAFGANERLVFGVIGCGGRGNGNMGRHLKDIVAVCDVDSKHAARAKGRVEKSAGRECQVFGDYRKLLEIKDIDAVIISTPDHWHALPTINACEAGKDVYIEKPMTLTIEEGQAMIKAARRFNRIVQVGSQQRSANNFRTACELVRSGRLGKIQTVLVGIAGVNYKGPPVPDSDPPPELDYDFWLGPAPWRPYNVKRVHYQFRFFWDYSGGQMTNWGAHHLDIAQWGLGMDESGPVEISAKAKFHPQGWYEVPQWCEVTYKYANGITMICGQSQPGGTTFIGEKGRIHVNRGRLESDPPEIIKQPIGEDDVHLYVSNNHMGNWLDCIKSRKLPICDVAIGHRSASVCHLGNIAIRTGEKVAWDPVAEKVTSGGKAATMPSKPYRAPWKLPYA
jgi:predicted dehydrogenase